jgi:hypothetical protein
MKEVHYGVVKFENRWKIIGKGLRFGSYDTKSDAVDIVRRIADHAAGLLPVRLHLDEGDVSVYWR